MLLRLRLPRPDKSGDPIDLTCGGIFTLFSLVPRGVTSAVLGSVARKRVPSLDSCVRVPGNFSSEVESAGKLRNDAGTFAANEGHWVGNEENELARERVGDTLRAVLVCGGRRLILLLRAALVQGG